MTSCGWDTEAARKDKVNSCFGPGTHVAEHEPMLGTSSNDSMFRSWQVSKRGDKAQWRVTLQWRAAENEILVKTWSDRAHLFNGDMLAVALAVEGEVEARQPKKKGGLDYFPAGICSSCKWVPAESDTGQGDTAVVAVAVATSAKGGDTNTGETDTGESDTSRKTPTAAATGKGQPRPLLRVELVQAGAGAGPVQKVGSAATSTREGEEDEVTSADQLAAAAAAVEQELALSKQQFAQAKLQMEAAEEKLRVAKQKEAAAAKQKDAAAEQKRAADAAAEQKRAAEAALAEADKAAQKKKKRVSGEAESGEAAKMDKKQDKEEAAADKKADKKAAAAKQKDATAEQKRAAEAAPAEADKAAQKKQNKRRASGEAAEPGEAAETDKREGAVLSPVVAEVAGAGEKAAVAIAMHDVDVQAAAKLIKILQKKVAKATKAEEYARVHILIDQLTTAQGSLKTKDNAAVTESAVTESPDDMVVSVSKDELSKEELREEMVQLQNQLHTLSTGESGRKRNLEDMRQKLKDTDSDEAIQGFLSSAKGFLSSCNDMKNLQQKLDVNRKKRKMQKKAADPPRPT